MQKRQCPSKKHVRHAKKEVKRMITKFGVSLTFVKKAKTGIYTPLEKNQGLKILGPPTLRAITTAILVITASQNSADPTTPKSLTIR